MHGQLHATKVISQMAWRPFTSREQLLLRTPQTFLQIAHSLSRRFAKRAISEGGETKVIALENDLQQDLATLPYRS